MSIEHQVYDFDALLQRSSESLNRGPVKPFPKAEAEALERMSSAIIAVAGYAELAKVVSAGGSIRAVRGRHFKATEGVRWLDISAERVWAAIGEALAARAATKSEVQDAD